MTKKSRKRSAASEVLHHTEGASKVDLSASDASVLTPDREIKIRKPVRLTRARAASIRRAIVTKTDGGVKSDVSKPLSLRRERALRTHGPIGNLTFMTGKLVGKTGAFFGKIKRLVKSN